jgi:hypothetical protein
VAWDPWEERENPEMLDFALHADDVVVRAYRDVTEAPLELPLCKSRWPRGSSVLCALP